MSFEDTIREIVREENDRHLQEIKKMIHFRNDYPAALTPMEAKEFLKIGRDRMYQLLHVPGFPAIRIGDHKYIIPTEQLFVWLSQQKDVDLKEVSA